MTKTIGLAGLLLVASLRLEHEPLAVAGRFSYPLARAGETVDSYHGVAVADPYRWLEDVGSPETSAWLSAQESLLESSLKPAAGRADLQRRLTALTSYDSYSIPIKAAGRYFFSKVDAGAGLDERTLVSQRSAAATPETVWRGTHGLDPGEQIGFFSPSPDARYLAYGITSRQSRWIRVRVVDLSAGVDLPDRIENLYAVAAGVSWTADSSGFYYTRFDAPAAGQAPATAGQPRIAYHAVGHTEAADPILGGVPTGPATILTHRTTQDGKYLVISAREGGSTRNEIYCQSLSGASPGPLRLTPGADAAYTFLGNRGSRLFLYTDRSAPRGRVVAIEAADPSPDRWLTVIPEAHDAIAALDQTGVNALGLYGDRLVLNYLEDGRPVVRIFSLAGRLEHVVRLPPAGFIWGGFSGRQDDPEVFYSFLGLTDPSTICRLDVHQGRVTTFKQASIPFDRDSIVVEQVFYQSHDGTRVPMFVAHKRALVRNGESPALIYGYGGLGWVSFIWYQPHILAWLELGGVYAQPSLRGGGEYGEAWHQAGIKTNKQNTVDDYVAAAEFLIANRYTSPARLVANGGSLSAPLAGTAALVQRRDLFAAAVIDRPVLDLIRFDRFSGGGYWRPEFGSTDDPAEFRALLANSPYHNVQSPRCYPATLVMSGDRDQTAVPLHAYKFTAALQAAQRCDEPVLLKVMHDAGHNFGNTPRQVVESFTDELSFLKTVLKIGDAPPEVTLAAATARLQAQDALGAARILEQLVAREPQNGRAWRTLGLALLRSKNPDAAIDAWQRALDVEPTAPLPYYSIGIAYAAKHDEARAFEWLEKAKATRKIDMTQISAAPELAALEPDARFAALLPSPKDFADPFVEPTRVIREWDGAAANDQFGWIARNIGDVDGDGVADVVTSAPTNGDGGEKAGRVYVYSTRTGRLLWSVTGQAGDQLGTGVEAAGDTNRDGVPDVVASAPGGGYAQIYSGKDGRVLRTLKADDRSDDFGRHVAGAGDVDRDGFSDVIVGAPGNSAAGKGAGRAYVYSGKTGRVLLTLTGEHAGDAFGSAVAGFTDRKRMLLLVGAPSAGPKQTGRTYVYSSVGPKPRFVIEADETGGALGGMFLSVPGDLDGDGFPDAYASDWNNNAKGPSTGRVYVHSGRDGRRLLALTGETGGEGFGTSPSVAGDVDGDGHADLIVGAWQYAGAAVGGGRAYLYSGKDGRLMKTYTCRTPGDAFGFDAVGMGDVDGDGTTDFLITSGWSGVHGFHSGRVFIISSGVKRSR